MAPFFYGCLSIATGQSYSAQILWSKEEPLFRKSIDMSENRNSARHSPRRNLLPNIAPQEQMWLPEADRKCPPSNLVPKLGRLIAFIAILAAGHALWQSSNATGAPIVAQEITPKPPQPTSEYVYVTAPPKDPAMPPALPALDFGTISHTTTRD